MFATPSICIVCCLAAVSCAALVAAGLTAGQDGGNNHQFGIDSKAVSLQNGAKEIIYSNGMKPHKT